MSGNADDPLLSAAGKISSGEPVDWKDIQDQMATPDQAAIVEELRSLERYAQVNEKTPASWGRFQIIEQIGAGTFGVVYRALDPTLQIEVALKVTHPRHPALASDQDKALEEARRLVKVKHPNVVRAFGAERVGDEIGLSMELVNGRTLDEIVRRQAPFGANEAVVIGIDLCRALAAVHNAGVLHGDIKAHNVMREDGGRTVLMDFGTSRDIHRQPPAPGGDFAGTPLYLAPEVFAGKSRTMASEIYSVGVLLYFLVSGLHPFEGETRTVIGELHARHAPHKPLRDLRPDLPDSFIRVVDRALSESPEHRYESAGALETALVRVLSARPDSNPPSPVLKVLLAALALVVLGLGALAVSRLKGGGALAPVPSANLASEYRIDAAFYRERAGLIERLTPGEKLLSDETLSLQVELSTPAYVYVVNEDEKGESYLLFPIPGLALRNPLPPGQRHRLPGMWDGEPVSWQVTSAGRNEHFLIVASPQRSPEFEEMFASLPQPSFGKPALKLSADGVGRLRSVGGLTASPVRTNLQLRLLPEFSTPLADGEERVRGLWIRQATFGNPEIN